jgi:hypothetical protein
LSSDFEGRSEHIGGFGGIKRDIDDIDFDVEGGVFLWTCWAKYIDSQKEVAQNDLDDVNWDD